jgi:hypothetical protein
MKDATCRTGLVDDCMKCCDDNHPNAYTMQADATRRCVCSSPGACAMVCATSYCMSKPETMMGCYECVFPELAAGAECFQAGVDACGTNSECTGYVACRANCVR